MKRKRAARGLILLAGILGIVITPFLCMAPTIPWFFALWIGAQTGVTLLSLAVVK